MSASPSARAWPTSRFQFPAGAIEPHELGFGDGSIGEHRDACLGHREGAAPAARIAIDVLGNRNGISRDAKAGCLERLCDEHSRELSRLAGELHARLHYARTDEIIRFGLHEYLVDFLERVTGLSSEISRVFLVPTY